MIAIADEANAEGRNAWPSIGRIARHRRLSVRNVKRLLPILEKSGELIIDAGRVLLPQNTEWVYDFVEELAKAPPLNTWARSTSSSTASAGSRSAR
jgi:hypothetical protein